MGRLRDWIEAALPWYQPDVERDRDARTERIVQRSETARSRATRATRVIAEYQRAEAVATRAGDRVGQAVTDLREAQQGATAAGEQLIAEVERPSDAE